MTPIIRTLGWLMLPLPFALLTFLWLHSEELMPLAAPALIVLLLIILTIIVAYLLSRWIAYSNTLNNVERLNMTGIPDQTQVKAHQKKEIIKCTILSRKA